MSAVDAGRRHQRSAAPAAAGRVLPMRRPAPPSRVLVVVPAFNEESTVAGVVTEVRTHNPGVAVLVVDDGSVDATADAARAAGALVCRLPFNLGVGGAMRAGFRFALETGYDAVVQVDADGQHDPTYIPALLRGLAEADVVIGSRFAGAGDYRARRARRWAMALLAFVVSRLAHSALTDVTSGYRASNRRAMRVFAAHYPAEYLGDTVESLIIALRSTCLVAQVPVVMRARGGGRASQSPVRAAVYLLRACAAIALALVRRWPMPARLEEA